MQALLIDPAERTVSPVQLDGGNIDRMQQLIGCETFTAAYLPNGDTIYVDDEGLFKQTSFFLIEGITQPLAGKGLLMGSDDQGNSTEPSVSREWVVDNIDFGHPMIAGPVVLFMGDRAIREIPA